jgi:hypothetical protein
MNRTDYPAASSGRGEACSWMNQQTLASITPISERTWERMRGEGTGPPFTKAGRKVLYRWGDVEDWLARRSFRSTAEAKRAMALEHSSRASDVRSP